MVECTKECANNRGPHPTAVVDSMHFSLKRCIQNNFCREERSHSHGGASGTHACSARGLSKRARVSRAVLFLLSTAAVGAPLSIDGDSGPPVRSNPVSRGVNRLTSFLEASLDAEPEVVSENIEGIVNKDRQGDLESSEQISEGFPMDEVPPNLKPESAIPTELRGMVESVPLLLPIGPFIPRSGGFSADVETQDLQPSVRFEQRQQAAFYGPQSDELLVDDCQHFDAFLVSPLPSSVASRFTDFVQKESQQADGMPYLHHIHGSSPAADAAEGEANPRLVVEGGKVTSLWSEDVDDTPIFMMEEGTATLFRLVAPVKNAYDAVAAMMLMPIVKVDIAYGDGLLLSYRVSGDEGKQVNHQHVDGMHRPVADLDVVYKSCFSVGDKANEPIPVRAELRFANCEPVILMWRVICSASALSQDLALGFHVAVGPATPPQLNESEGENESSEGAVDSWNPTRVPFPTVAELRALTTNEGDLVADGSPTERVATVQTTSLLFSPAQNFVEMIAWCNGCEAGKIEVQVPTVAADLEVTYPLLYKFEGKAQQAKSDGGKMTSLVASKPSSHLTIKDIKIGEEENVQRLILDFRCKSDGESIVALDFSFHAYKDVQIFFKKRCAAPPSSIVRDPSCSSGLLSEDGNGCCLASCGTCGGDGCEDREGGLMGCCLTHIRSSGVFCESSNAPCIMAGGLQSISPPVRAREAGKNLALPEEEKPRQHFRLFMGALWLLHVATSLLKIFCWCLMIALLFIYLFSFCYGIHVLKEPVPVAATPSVTQLLNAVFMLCFLFMRIGWYTEDVELCCIWLLMAGHLRHLYRTHFGSSFGTSGFHSYSPFEENVVHNNNKPTKPRNGENPFFQNARWRSDEPETSFIRLTSFKDKSNQQKKSDPLQGARPMEFCDVEAEASTCNARACTDNDILWGEPQDNFTSDGWNDNDDNGSINAGGIHHTHAHGAGAREEEEGFEGRHVKNSDHPFKY